jgi:steroid delta-isomerase-like uncharacterized protein
VGNSLASKIKEANRTIFTNGDLDAVGEFFSPDYKVHLTGRVVKGGHSIVREILGSLRRSFPDIEVEIDILLEGEARVAWQRTLRGTHAEKFKSFPGSGVQIVWRDMVTSQFRNGLIVEEWVITDLAEQLLLSRKRKS